MTTPMRNVEHLPYLLLLHCCRLGWLCITAWLQIGLRRKLSSLFPQRSQHYSNSCESNSSCFTASSWSHRKIMDKPRKTWENHGTTPEIPGKNRGMSVFQKCLSVIFRSRRVRPGFRKSLRGDSFKSPSNLGKSWKITSNFKASMKQQNSWFFWHMRKQFVNKMFGRN